jgi:hypothetical protein
LRIDDVDRQPPDMIGLYRVGDLLAFPLGGLGRRESGGSSLNFILAA